MSAQGYGQESLVTSEDLRMGDWPPDVYQSDVVRSKPVRRAGSAACVEDVVEIEYAGRTLVIKTILEEDELAPLFDGAYWPGTMVWPVSLWTGEFIHRTYRGRMPGARVVELGCGCGVPGMMCQMMGASVALTEQRELMRIINANVQSVFGDAPDPPIFAEPLSWSRESARRLMECREGWSKVDFVICCDCIYEPFWGESYRLLLDAILELSSGDTVSIVSVERRNADGVDKFLALANEVMKVTMVQCDPQRAWQLYVLRCNRAEPGESVVASLCGVSGHEGR